ncbi:MAG: thiamine pyrophosphate-binding protein [Methanobrevibacter sp.]|nr:thiamine pyrophosphate-binding protein [Methanobrevibacter sp.]
MNTAEAIVKILEDNGVKKIFGHPGEQILPFYKALSSSNIEHVLTRNEQGAAMAADGYARSLGEFGVCLSTAGPGALNLLMGVAVSYKDSVPLLVITGDVPYYLKGENTFQDVDLVSMFKSIAIKSFFPHNGKTAIVNIKQAVEILKKEPCGPVHINLSKDILLDEDIGNIIGTDVEYNPNYDYSNLDEVVLALKQTKKPLLLIGAGVSWSKSVDKLKNLIETYNLPIATTYHGNGIIDSKNNLNLGMMGIRGNPLANYAFKNSDLVLVLGANLNERTLNPDVEDIGPIFKIYRRFKPKIIHVNIDKKVLKGNINIHGDIKEVLSHLEKNEDIFTNIDKNWLFEIYESSEDNTTYQEDNLSENLNDDLLDPEIVIRDILESNRDSFVVGDAGSHTTWVAIFSNPSYRGKLIYSGGMAPMGYGLPGAIGAAIGNPNKKIIAIVGDGGIQMNIQELATIAEYKLPIAIFLLNNNQLGVIRQWEKQFYDMEPYEVDLSNPDFLAIVNAYGIDCERVNTYDDLETAINKAKSIDKPYLVEIFVNQKDIPFPK